MHHSLLLLALSSQRKLSSFAQGYTGQHCETDINECYSDPCHYGTCKDGLASFTCYCRPGYTGRLCETNINECLSQPCRNGGTCQDRENSYICACPKGTAGRTCGLHSADLRCGIAWLVSVLPRGSTCVVTTPPHRRFQLRDQPGRLQEQTLRLRPVHRQNQRLRVRL